MNCTRHREAFTTTRRKPPDTATDPAQDRLHFLSSKSRTSKLLMDCLQNKHAKELSSTNIFEQELYLNAFQDRDPATPALLSDGLYSQRRTLNNSRHVMYDVFKSENENEENFG